MYAAADSDIMIVATPHGAMPPLSDQVFSENGLAQALLRIDVRTLTDMRIRKLGSKASLAPFFRAIQRADNSDYYPVLDLMAVKTRFLRSTAVSILDIRGISRRLEDQGPYSNSIAPLSGYASGMTELQAETIPEYLEWAEGKRAKAPYKISKDTAAELALLRSLNDNCDPHVLLSVWLPAFRTFVASYLPYFSEAAENVVAGELKAAKCYASAPAPIHEWIELLQAAGARNWPRARDLEHFLLPDVMSDQANLDFLEQELVLADLKTGGPAAARQQLKELGGINQSSMPLLYLWALAMEKQ